MMYSGGRGLPYLLAKARAGDFAPFAETAIQSNRGLYGSVRIGLNLAISCSEFIPAITRAEASRATKNSFLGSARIDNQRAACSEWPRTHLSRGFFSPFRSNVPSLIVSGLNDPVVRPYWAERAKSYLPNSRNLSFQEGMSRTMRASAKRRSSCSGAPMPGLWI